MRKLLVFCIYTTATFILISLSGCQKSEAKESKSDWYNNPKKIVVAKKSETLTDLAHRLFNKSILSLGISPSKEWNLYESGAIWLGGDPIASVSQRCGTKGQLSIGEAFDGIGCEQESISKLVALSISQPTIYKEYCELVEYDPSQSPIGYANNQTRARWSIEKGKLISIGISASDHVQFEIEGHIEACDLKVRAYSKEWHKIDTFIWNMRPNCIVDQNGPANFMEALDRSRQSYRVKDEVYMGEKVVQTTIVLNGQGEHMYFRGRARCETYINFVMSQKDAEKKKNRAKYE